MPNYHLLDFKAFGDLRGSLVSLESQKNIPFDIQRIYYIYDTKRDVPRGSHAHRDLEQVLVCVNGSCKVKVDDGQIVGVFELNTPEKGLYVGKMLWREMFDFSQGCVLLVLASAHYHPEEYIRDYDDFLKEVSGS
ncbi:MAG: WxcM-like domain-containing protein [Vampirovibrio sp.]